MSPADDIKHNQVSSAQCFGDTLMYGCIIYTTLMTKFVHASSALLYNIN